MENYLSIGEVSKMKGVSKKSLRYYDDLGILPPAYVNRDTGYRYYTMNQMVVLDLICTCIELDIPLKRFKRYILPDQILNAEKILSDGKEIVQRKIKSLHKNLDQLEKWSNHLNETQELYNHSNVYIRHIEKRFYLTAPFEGDIDDISYFYKEITKLHNKVKQYDFTFVIEQGLFFIYNENVCTPKIFVELNHRICDCADLVTIREDDFQCEIFQDNELVIAEKYLNNKKYEDGTILILRELFDKKMESKLIPMEVQLSLNKGCQPEKR